MIYLIIIPLHFLVMGLVLQTLWGWFIVPTFSLPELTLIHAIGIGLIMELYNEDLSDIKDKYKEPLSTRLALTFIKPMFLLFVGLIIK